MNENKREINQLYHLGYILRMASNSYVVFKEIIAAKTEKDYIQ
jgi:hypothetical protein